MVMIRKMIAESAGRLPAPLVVIILFALVMSVLAGFLLMGLQSENRGNGRYEFLPVRVAADQNAPAVTDKMLSGVWVSQQGEFVSSLLISGDKFEWMVRWGKDNNTRYYARGSLKTTGDVLVLGQRIDMGRPYDRENPFLSYMPLSLKDINVHVRFDPNAGKMIWTVPISERRRQEAFFLKALPPESEKEMVWIKPRKKSKT